MEERLQRLVQLRCVGARPHECPFLHYALLCFLVGGRPVPRERPLVYLALQCSPVLSSAIGRYSSVCVVYNGAHGLFRWVNCRVHGATIRRWCIGACYSAFYLPQRLS